MCETVVTVALHGVHECPLPFNLTAASERFHNARRYYHFERAERLFSRLDGQVASGWSSVGDGRFGRIAEKTLRAPVPACDDTIEVLTDYGVIAALDNGNEPDALHESVEVLALREQGDDFPQSLRVVRFIVGQHLHAQSSGRLSRGELRNTSGAPETVGENPPVPLDFNSSAPMRIWRTPSLQRFSPRSGIRVGSSIPSARWQGRKAVLARPPRLDFLNSIDPQLGAKTAAGFCAYLS